MVSHFVAADSTAAAVRGSRLIADEREAKRHAATYKLCIVVTADQLVGMQRSTIVEFADFLYVKVNMKFVELYVRRRTLKQVRQNA